MAEEVNYASVVFNARKNPSPEAQNEGETVYDEVKVQSETSRQTVDVNAGLPDKKANGRRRHSLLLAGCLCTFCVILLIGIIVICILIPRLIYGSDESLLNQLRENQTTLLAENRNLTNLNSNLSSVNENLRRENNNLTNTRTVLEKGIQTLETQNQVLETRNQDLKTQNQELKTQWNKFNITRAQWSVDQYCPKESNRRQCEACQKGWQYFSQTSSCFAINNADESLRKTWDEAQENCREKGSDLVVVLSGAEKKYVSDNSWSSSGTNGYWIGLRAEGGKWKWVNGSNLTDNSWIKPPSDNGQCAISVSNQGWISVSCSQRQQWICKKAALSI